MEDTEVYGPEDETKESTETTGATEDAEASPVESEE
mgnify:CR=1 FL=1